jgi:hypothetical protein
MTPEEQKAMDEFRNTGATYIRTPPKPIVVIKADLERIKPCAHDLLAELTHIFSEKMPDYHVFVLPNDDHEEPHDVLEFQVFYEKDFTDIQYQELKTLIEHSLPNKQKI